MMTDDQVQYLGGILERGLKALADGIEHELRYGLRQIADVVVVDLEPLCATVHQDMKLIDETIGISIADIRLEMGKKP
jgi:hypothetical protein